LFRDAALREWEGFRRQMKLLCLQDVVQFVREPPFLKFLFISLSFLQSECKWPFHHLRNDHVELVEPGLLNGHIIQFGFAHISQYFLEIHIFYTKRHIWNSHSLAARDLKCPAFVWGR
jgi:hypothetical protein